uniref:Transmembrane 9 superfamily member 4 n=1 Tax=Callithrix jacchus TaxID=9483 RepID=A0A8I3WQ99_CALJA
MRTTTSADVITATRGSKMATAMDWLPWSLLLLSLMCETSAFYVPGVAPINFHQNDPVEIKAVKLTSSRTQLPYEYYSLPFCQPRKITYKAENLELVLEQNPERAAFSIRATHGSDASGTPS